VGDAERCPGVRRSRKYGCFAPTISCRKLATGVKVVGERVFDLSTEEEIVAAFQIREVASWDAMNKPWLR